MLIEATENLTGTANVMCTWYFRSSLVKVPVSIMYDLEVLGSSLLLSPESHGGLDIFCDSILTASRLFTYIPKRSYVGRNAP